MFPGVEITNRSRYGLGFQLALLRSFCVGRACESWTYGALVDRHCCSCSESDSIAPVSALGFGRAFAGIRVLERTCLVVAAREPVEEAFGGASAVALDAAVSEDRLALADLAVAHSIAAPAGAADLEAAGVGAEH